MPEQYGGAGDDFTHEAVLPHEQTTAGEGSLGLAVHSGLVTGSGYLVRYGTEEQRRRWLPGLLGGELIGAPGMTEPDCGSDVQAIRTRAVRDSGAYRVGSKTFIADGDLADPLVPPGKTDRSAAAHGIPLLICEARRRHLGFRRAASRRSACTPTAPRSCSSTRCGHPRRTCSAARRTSVSSSSCGSFRRSAWRWAWARRAVEPVTAYAKERQRLRQATDRAPAWCWRTARPVPGRPGSSWTTASGDVPVVSWTWRPRPWRSCTSPRAVRHGRPLPADRRRPRLHHRVPDRPDVRGRPGPEIYGGTNELMKELITRVL